MTDINIKLQDVGIDAIYNQDGIRSRLHKIISNMALSQSGGFDYTKNTPIKIIFKLDENSDIEYEAFPISICTDNLNQYDKNPVMDVVFQVVERKSQDFKVEVVENDDIYLMSKYFKSWESLIKESKELGNRVSSFKSTKFEKETDDGIFEYTVTYTAKKQD